VLFRSDGSFQNETETAQDVLGLHLAAPTIGIWTARLDGGQTRDDSENFLNGAATGRFDTKKNYASLLNELRFGERQSLILGADYEDDEVDSTTVFAVDSRDNTGLFAQYLTRIADVEAQASLRSDDNEQFGKHTTGGAGLGGALGGGLRWMLAYGTAFKAPTFNELYFPDFGNPDLEPEESQSLEAGLSGNHGWGRWTLNVFQNRVDELIGFDANFSPVNIDEARILGVETTLSGRLAGTDVATAYTWMDPENRADGSNKGKVLPRRARQSFRIDVDRALGVWRLGGTLRGEGKRYDDLANTRELGGYATLDLRAEIAFAPGWRLQLRGENLLDKQYETAEFFNQQDAAGWLTLRYQIGH
jgi:vitamin B12 transporter